MGAVCSLLPGTVVVARTPCSRTLFVTVANLCVALLVGDGGGRRVQSGVGDLKIGHNLKVLRFE